MYFVYILSSLVNNKTYVGNTSLAVATRLKQHNLGSNKWTKTNGPFKLVYYESYICKSDSLLREKFFKSGVGKQIKNLIVNSLKIS